MHHSLFPDLFKASRMSIDQELCRSTKKLCARARDVVCATYVVHIAMRKVPLIMNLVVRTEALDNLSKALETKQFPCQRASKMW